MNSLAENLRRLRTERRLSQAQLADLTNGKVSQQLVSQIERGANESTKELPALALALGVNIADLDADYDVAVPIDAEAASPKREAIPVVGILSAGDEWSPVDQYAPGDGMDTVDVNLSDADPIALRVRGTSMVPVFRDGDDIVCSRRRGRDIQKCLNRDCAIMTADGRGFIKVLLAGTTPSTYRLRSYNPAYPDIENVRLEWAAPVVWIHRR